ncbi:MAG: hypothetical protein RLZZ08_2024, partial [Pseudomonadota bacterium]
MQHLPKGTVLFTPGQDCAGFVVLRRGTIKVTLTGESGREIVLYRVQPGEVCLQTFGCLITGTPYGAQGVADSDLELEVVPATSFQQRIVDDSLFRQQLFAAVAARFADMERLVEDVVLTGFEARLARTLLRLMDHGGRVCATHEELAAEMGSGRAAVSRGLAAFARSGLVTMERAAIQVIDAARLGMHAHDPV